MQINLNENPGQCILGYGATGDGKTGAILTLNPPIRAYITEPRHPGQTFRSCYPERFKELVANDEIELIQFDTAEEYIEDMSKLKAIYSKGDKPFKSIAFDSLTFENSKIKLALEDSRYEKEVDLRGTGKRDRTLVDRYRMELQDHGTAASIMKRITALLNSFTIYGVTTYATAAMDETPSWNRTYDYAPLFFGKDYPSLVHGYFDFIGCIVPPSEGSKIPRIRFTNHGTTDKYFVKSCSDQLNEKLASNGGFAPLDFGKILEVING